MLQVISFFLILTVFAHFLPEWTRPDVFFAVTIDPAFRRSGAGRHILQQYRIILWATTAATVGAFLETRLELVLLLLQIAGFLGALTLARHRVLSHAAPPPTTIEVDLRAPAEKFPGGALAALLPLISSVLLTLWAYRHWAQLPERIPLHIGLLGVNRWVMRTAASVYGFIGTQAAVCMILVISAWGVLHWSRRFSGLRADAARDRQVRRLNVHMLLTTAYFLAAWAWIVLLKSAAAGLAATGILLLIAIYCFRLIRVSRSIPAVGGDRTPDACWKLGIFYFNPADPSLFVAKRLGIGYTLNFGNRWAWAVLGAITIVAVTRKLLR